MENSMSRMLIETIVKRSIKNIKNNPERGIRNLIDMALQFSEGRFQQNFFSTAQSMLQNENSAYYSLVRDTVSSIDTERLCTFGMNLGYNSCTVGAQQIRENEKRLNCNIPWTIILQIDEEHWKTNKQSYHNLVREGETLGIYMWMLFVRDQPEKVLDLAEGHTDSNFCLFCQVKDLTPSFLDEISELNNVMLAVRYEENSARIFDILREKGLLYSVWYQYGQKDTEDIINGDLFDTIQQLTPLFTVLLPKQNCPKMIQDLVYKVVKRVRKEQTYHTLLWELQSDNHLIDAIISNDTCSVYFDNVGNLRNQNKKTEDPHNNLFQNSLIKILTIFCPKEKEVCKIN